MTLNLTIWPFISNAILLLGVVVATCAIFYNVRTAKKKETAHFLFESRQDTAYTESLHVLKKVNRSGKSFRSYIFPREGKIITEKERVERRKLQYILNFYERVAVAIREGIYDEQMIKRASFTTVIQAWDIAEPLIKAIREHIHSETTYQEFEWLVMRWKQNPLQKK